MKSLIFCGLTALASLAGPGDVRMIADVNQQPEFVGAYPSNLIPLGERVFFTASSRVYGDELWVTDGAEAGARLVKDLQVGQRGSFPSNLRKVGAELFFFADDGESGMGLWKTDGEETTMITGVASRPQETEVASGLFYFVLGSRDSFPGLFGWSLWQSDGTEAGTQLLNPLGSTNDFLSRPFGYPEFLTEMNGSLFFSNSGRQLWRSSGTREETVRVDDFGEGAQVISMVGAGDRLWISLNRGDDQELWSWKNGEIETIASFPNGAIASNGLTAREGRAFFVTTDPEAGAELWTSDGTITRRVADIRAGEASSFPVWMTWWEGMLYFTAEDGITGRGLWASDGEIAWAVKTWSDQVEPESLVSTAEALFFIRCEEEGGASLWRSDGTEAGTQSVKQVMSPESWSARLDMVTTDNELYFRGSVGSAGLELWKSDGTPEGTGMWYGLEGTKDGFVRISPGGLAAWGDELVFCGNDGISGEEPWITDGTEVGTRLLKDVHPGPGNSTPNRMTVAGENFYFSADDGTHGSELWRSGPSGTALVRDINGGSATSHPGRMTAFDGRLAFTARDEMENGLWLTDGETVEKIKGDVGSQVGTTPLNNGLLFTARDSGEEPWWTDGETTRMLRDIRPGPLSSSPAWFTTVGSEAYFQAFGGDGFRLWKTDGTELGTVQVSGWEGPGSIYPLVAAGNRLFFFEEGSNEPGLRLWTVRNGRAELVRQIGESAVSNPFNFPADPYVEACGDLLFFVADDGEHGNELWRSDGTAAGTVMVRDLREGVTGSDPVYLKAIGGSVFFQANDVTGEELWVSDGTEEGTQLVTDLVPGSGGSAPGPMMLAGRRLFFSAETEDYGYEPHVLDVGAILDFRAWTDAAGLRGMDAVPSATPHGDDVDNLLKYAFGIDGSVPHQGSSNGQVGQLPRITVTTTEGKSTLTVEYVRRVGSSLVYLAQRAESLEGESFVPMNGEETIGPEIDGWQKVTRTESVGFKNAFARVLVRTR